jgi:predicted dienelactone hydrolase
MKRLFTAALAASLLLAYHCGYASLGLTQIAGKEGDGPVTVFYPTAAAEQPTRRGPFTLSAAVDAAPARGNGRLIVISHGSGGAPWTHSNLARALVEAGFVVALPEHRGDNFRSTSDVGPESWKRRPAEAARAIDAVAADARLAPLVKLDRVGAYGMSAGGHTMLTLAGGRWSPEGIKKHCEAHIAEDFYSCVGLSTQRKGDWLDGVKEWTALRIIGWKFSDPTLQSYEDPRIAAVVAGVPYAADFEMASLAKPRVPLALVTAKHDLWLVPRFHSDQVLKACGGCLHLADIDGGHGALLSPPPPGVTGILGDLINDPPGFDRSQLPAIDQKIVGFFREQLLR